MESSSITDARRRLPSVDRLLAAPEVEGLLGLYGRAAVRVQARRLLADLRGELGAAGGELPERFEQRLAELPGELARRVEERLGERLGRVLNATGIFLHTNLGRSPLPRPVARALPALLESYCDLELDLASGRRGERNRRAATLLRAATGAEAATVTNNAAGAVLLAVAALAAGREVIISRGELIEIGGSFRIPEILTAAGARLVEVGTTNRTRRADYEAAIGEETGLLLKVFPSNYRIRGFVEEVEAAVLVELGRRRGVAVMVDEGSGLLAPRREPQLADHRSLSELIADGVDLACGSGDKLLGGPQAGLLVGRREAVERCRRHPLYRPLRPDRAAYAGLEAVLRLHLAGGPLPLERMWVDPEVHRRRLERVRDTLGRGEIVAADAYLGGGSAAEMPIPGEALAVAGGESLAVALRTGSPPVVGYVSAGRVVLDLRTVDPEDDEELVAAVGRAVEAAG